MNLLAQTTATDFISRHFIDFQWFDGGVTLNISYATLILIGAAAALWGKKKLKRAK